MALNLNKGDDNNSKPSTEKKGLNLSKSADASKVKPNLTKDNPAPAVDSKSSNIQTDAKKKSPALIITLALVIIGIGVFWFMNKNTTNQNKLETAVSAEVQETAPSEANTRQTNQTTDSNNTNAGDNVQTGEVKSTPTSSNVSPTTDATNPNSTERVTTKTNQNSTTNAAPSSNSVLPIGSIEEKARQVISGAFGNGADRKQALGEDYAEIQAKVNEIYKNKYQ
jgi:preprotein translocase subunit SecF